MSNLTVDSLLHDDSDDEGLNEQERFMIALFGEGRDKKEKVEKEEARELAFVALDNMTDGHYIMKSRLLAADFDAVFRTFDKLDTGAIPFG